MVKWIQFQVDLKQDKILMINHGNKKAQDNLLDKVKKV